METSKYTTARDASFLESARVEQFKEQASSGRNLADDDDNPQDDSGSIIPVGVQPQAETAQRKKVRFSFRGQQEIPDLTNTREVDQTPERSHRARDLSENSETNSETIHNRVAPPSKPGYTYEPHVPLDQQHVPRELRFDGAANSTALPDLQEGRQLRSRDTSYFASEDIAPIEAAFFTGEASLVPTTTQEAQAREDWGSWMIAYKAEYQSLLDNSTFEITTLPSGRLAIPTKWVHDLKRDKEGKIIKYKARIVAKGFKQQAGIDFFETFSPVACYQAIRVFLTIAAARNWEIKQVDAVTAFLNAPLQEDIYMKIPDGIPHQPGEVWLLRKALYGLKQAGRQWYLMLLNALTSYGLKATAADGCVLVSDDGDLAILTIVDDMAIAGDATKVENLIKHLETLFKMKRMGDLDVFVGLEISRNRSARTITIQQTRYISDILKRFNITDQRSSLPIAQGTRLEPAASGDERTDRLLYQSYVGSLMFLMIGSRPDLAYAAGILSRFSSDPTVTHLKAIQKAFAYIAGTANFGLQLGGDTSLAGWVDSAYGDDRLTGKSTAGYIFKVGIGAVSWSSKKQSIVAQSTTEAEYIAAAEAAKEAIWLNSLLDSFGCKAQTPKLYCDNTGALDLANNNRPHGKTRHINIRYHFLRQCIYNEDLELRYIWTKQQLADALTKPLTIDTFNTFRKAIGLKACTSGSVDIEHDGR